MKAACHRYHFGISRRTAGGSEDGSLKAAILYLKTHIVPYRPGADRSVAILQYSASSVNVGRRCQGFGQLCDDGPVFFHDARHQLLDFSLLVRFGQAASPPYL